MNINNNNISFDETRDDPLKMFKIIITLVFMFAGIIFVIVGSIENKNEKEISKDYLEINGILVDYKYVGGDGDKDKDKDEYEGIYQYTVDGNDYYVSPSRITNKSAYKDIEVVRYNPKNPSESIIYANWDSLVIGGYIVSGITLIILICILFKKL